MERLRKGEGITRVIKATMPTKNEDGSDYVHGEEDYFEWFIDDNPTFANNPPPIATELVDGEFTDALDPDTVPAGELHIAYKTVNVVLDEDGNPVLDNGEPRVLRSRMSEVLSFEILPALPKSPPLPPTF